MKICFIIPYFNHPKTIAKICSIISPFGKIIIVDDFSNNEAKNALESLDAIILHHKKNCGKGAAVKTALKHALKLGFSHAFQIDADMQHDLDKIPEFLFACQNQPQALICGCGIYDKSAPKSRVFGRKITNFWIKLNSLNTNIKDAMTGMRIYPLQKTCELLSHTKANRMDFDIEILLNIYRADIKVEWIGVDVSYSDAPSHFLAFRDNFLIAITHTKGFLSLPAFIYKRFKNAK